MQPPICLTASLQHRIKRSFIVLRPARQDLARTKPYPFQSKRQAQSSITDWSNSSAAGRCLNRVSLKVCTFHLRRGVKFHTTPWFKPTREFNAEDVLFTFEWMRNPNMPFRKARPV